MKREYGTEVIAGKPQVAYREAMTAKSEFSYTHKKQTGGSGQYGKVAGYIEPLPAEHETGFEFVDDITGGSIPREFIPACEKGFREAVKKGPLIGFPIVGVRCVINDGASHPVDSSEIAFRTAALMGFREAYERAKPTILEPIMRVEVQFPEEFQGAVLGQINQRRGTIISTEKLEGFVQAMADVPLNDVFGYSTDIRSATQGKGEFTMEFSKYAEVPKQQRDARVQEVQGYLSVRVNVRVIRLRQPARSPPAPGSPPSGGENKDRVGVGAKGRPSLPRTCARVVRPGTVSGPEVVGRRWVGRESIGCRWVGSELAGGERELRLGRRARRVEAGRGGRQSDVLQDARDRFCRRDRCDDLHAAPAATAFENVIQKHAPYQRRPWNSARPSALAGLVRRRRARSRRGGGCCLGWHDP